jgi:predicted MFS family arabinose efflux permease
MSFGTSSVKTPPSWHLVLLIGAASAILSVGIGLRQSLGLFLQPMNADLGVSASEFGFAMALANLVWGLSQPFVGMLGDRYGARPLVIGCAVIYAAGLVLMALAGPLIGLNIGGGLLLGLGVAGTSFGVLLGAVARAVPAEKRMQTLGLVSAAGSLATLVLAPLGQLLISDYGWRTALIVFAAIALAMAAIAIGLGADKAAPSTAQATEPALSIRQALSLAAGHSGFVAMVIAFFACGFQLMYITTHLPSYLAICGLPASVSASALGVIGLGNAVGSYAAGMLGARYSQKRLLALVYLFRTAAIVCFIALPVTPYSALIFSAAMGLLWLSVTPLVSGLIAHLFGLRHFNTLFGIAFLSHQIGAFTGSWLGGVTFDLTGSYTTAWFSMIVIGVSAFALQWFMDDRPPAPSATAIDRLGVAPART